MTYTGGQGGWVKNIHRLPAGDTTERCSNARAAVENHNAFFPAAQTVPADLMPVVWEKTGQTKAPLPKVIEYFMSPENEAKNHPKLVGDIKNIHREGGTVTWDQRLVVMGMSFRSRVRTSLDRATNTTRTESIAGSGKGTTMMRVMKETPTGTEVHFTYNLKVGRLTRLFVETRAKRGFEETVDEDMKALDGLA